MNKKKLMLNIIKLEASKTKAWKELQEIKELFENKEKELVSINDKYYDGLEELKRHLNAIYIPNELERDTDFFE